MEEEGAVSLWLGNAGSREVLYKALDVRFSDDGDFLGSPFSRAFGIEYYEDGLREAEYFEVPSSDLSELLRGTSYEETVVEGFRRHGDPPVSNCIVLLYNYCHTHPRRWSAEGISLGFFGVARYR